MIIATYSFFVSKFECITEMQKSKNLLAHLYQTPTAKMRVTKKIDKQCHTNHLNVRRVNCVKSIGLNNVICEDA